MTPAPPASRRRTIGLMAGLMLGVLLALMDQTVVSTAMPTIVGQLGGLNLYAGVFAAYMLAQASFLTIFGKLSDLCGRRRIFFASIGAFMLGSILCGQARTMGQLILFRGLQGIGGAGLMPTALAILGVHYAPRERARLQGLLGGGAGLAVIAGPIVGSLIVSQASWRWVFYVNLPLGLLSALLVTLTLRESDDTHTAPRIDYAGALALIGWVVALMLASSFGRANPWNSVPGLGAFAAFVLLFAFFIFQERRAAEPILPLRIFAHPTVAAAGAVTLIRAVATYSLLIYIPLLVQGVLAGSPESARNALTAFALPGIVGAAAAGFLVARGIGYRPLMIAGLALSGTGLWWVGGMGVTASPGDLLPALVTGGLGVGMTQVTIILALQNSVSREHMGTASSLSQFLSNLAGTVGMTLLGAYQADRLATGVASLLDSPAATALAPALARTLRDVTRLGQALTTPEVAAQLPPALLLGLRAALLDSLQAVFQVGLILTGLAMLASLLMRGSASEASGRLAPAESVAHPGA